MSQALASPSACCTPCDETINVAIPGPQGEPGTDGTNGTNGLNAFTGLTDTFTVPNTGSPDIAEVANSDWATVGQIIFLENAGYFEVVSIPDDSHIELDNTDYTGNAADGTVIAIGSHLGPGGIKGANGTNGTGDMLYADNLNAMASNDTSLANLGGTTAGLGFFKITSPSAVTFPRINADNTVTARTAANLRTDLTLVPGTDVQVFDTDLTAIAALVSAADQVPYATGAGTWALFTASSVGRSLIAQTTVALMRSVLGKVLPRYGLLASLASINLNSAASDNAVTVESSRYRIDKIIVDNASINITTATLGVFTAAGGAGTTVVADQAITALTAATKFMDLTLGGSVTADVLTAGTIYLRVGTAQGAPATANVWVFGWALE